MPTENETPQSVPKPGEYVQWKNYNKSTLLHYGFVLRVTPGFMGNQVIELRRFGKSGLVLAGFETYNLIDMRDCEPAKQRMGDYNTAHAERAMQRMNQ